jgi:hypothetical protein
MSGKARATAAVRLVTPSTSVPRDTAKVVWRSPVVRPDDHFNGKPRGAAMQSTISEYVIKAREADARRAGERDRLLLEVRRTRMTMRRRPSPAKCLANLLARRARALKRQALGSGVAST